MAFWNPFKKVQTSEQVLENNPNAAIFNQSSIDNDIDSIVSKRSVVSQQDTSRLYTNPLFSTIANSMAVLPLLTDKTERIRQYRSIAMFPECDWCLDEICDNFVFDDEDGDIIKLKLPDGKSNINTQRYEILQDQFKRYMEYFRLKEEGYNLIKRFLIEGELAFENVINKDKPGLGIIGVKFIPAEYYNTLIDTKTGRSAGIYFDKTKFANDLNIILSQSYLGSSQVFNTMMTTQTPSFNAKDCVVMLWPQITYINSGEYSPDGLISYSMLEKAKQAYHQLSLLQDAAVILRVTRAPERLLFNVSTGRMNQNYANEYVRNFAQELKSKKVARPGKNGQPDIAGVYNPVSMLESYVFGKSDANEGTTVESVGSSASYDEIGDIEYFLRRLMKQFKVPFSRYKTPEGAIPADDSITYEEYAFSRMIIRFQRRFASGFKKGFITHLKLMGIWDKYNLKDNDITVEFNKPDLYDLYNTQKMVSAKMDTYKAITDHEEFSKTLAMKKILGMRDDEIEQNFKMLTKEKQINAMSDKLTESIGDNIDPNSPYAQSPLPLKPEEKKEEGEEDKKPEEGKESSSDEKSEEKPEEEKKEEKPEEEKKEEEKKEEKVEPTTPTFGLG